MIKNFDDAARRQKKAKEQSRKDRLREKLKPLMGMTKTEATPPEAPNADDLNLGATPQLPHGSWKHVQAKDIGEGFQTVDESVFDDPPIGETDLFAKPFKNRFVIGTSRHITYTVKVKFSRRKEKIIKDKAINANNRVTKGEKRKFNARLVKNIDHWKSLFIDELLPVTMSLQTASEDVKDKMSQIADDPSVMIPIDYIQMKTMQAVQLRIFRTIGQQLGLTPEEQRALMPDFSPKLRQAKNEL